MSKSSILWKKLSYHPRAWYSPIFRNPVARYQGEQAAPLFSEHLKLCRTPQPCVRGPVVEAGWTPWSTPSKLAASGVQWSHELVPMTKTCGSSGQTKRQSARSELHLCPQFRELSQLQCLLTRGGTFYAHAVSSVRIHAALE